MSQYARGWWSGLAVCALAACGGDDAAPPGAASSGDPPGCAADAFIAESGACERAGLPESRCGPSERLLENGECRAAGVHPLECGAGFVAEGGGCKAMLPAEPCGDGEMAVPGETACHPVGECPSGKWPDPPPAGAEVAHVDGSYTGADSDGTAARPWLTVQAGIDAVADGGFVMVAAGTYEEAVEIDGKSVRLDGGCPARVRIVGAGAPAISVLEGADDTELRGLDITGPSLGVLVSGSEQLNLQQLRIHDTGARGINAESTLGPTSFALGESLVERAGEFGIFVSGAQVTIGASVVRQTRIKGTVFGHGVSIISNGEQPALATIASSVIEANAEANVFVAGSKATVEGSVLRDARAAASDGSAVALVAQIDPGGARADVSALGSVLSGCRSACVLAGGSDLLLERTTVRDTTLDASGAFGFGIDAQSMPPARSTVTVRNSLIERSTGVGIKAGGSDLVLEGVLVRDVAIDSVVGSGLGVYVHGDLDSAARGSLTMTASKVERAHDSGVVVTTSDATFEGVEVRDTNPDTSGWYGRGLAVANSVVAVRRSLFANNSEMGIFAISSELRVEQSEVRDVRANGQGRFGDGITVVSDAGITANATILGSRIEGAQRAGIASFGARVAFGRTLVGCAGYPLEGEHLEGASFAFEKLGEMRCGCPSAEGECQVLSSGIEAPGQLPTAP